MASEGPVAIVTGAGSGIGRCVAVRLARRGWRLALVGRRDAALAETAKLCAPAACVALAHDLAAPNAPARVADGALTALGRIDALVNNAAVAPAVPIARTDRALLQQVLDLDVVAPALLVVAAAAELRARRGVVVNVSSMAALDPFPGLFAYAAAKAALESQVRSIRNEWGGDGVRAYAVAPGAVETAMLRAIVDEVALPPAQTLAPDDVAAVIAACVLGERDEPSGSTIVVPSPA